MSDEAILKTTLHILYSLFDALHEKLILSVEDVLPPPLPLDILTRTEKLINGSGKVKIKSWPQDILYIKLVINCFISIDV